MVPEIWYVTDGQTDGRTNGWMDRWADGQRSDILRWVPHLKTHEL